MSAAALSRRRRVPRRADRSSGGPRPDGRHRLRWWEALPWLAAIGFYFAFPDYLGFGTELLITILFALSLDLALGYAGIITLGHAAFFGAGAYTVGMLAFLRHLDRADHEPGARRRGGGRGRLAVGPGPVAHQGLTLLMLTMCTMALLERGRQHGA